MKQGKILKTIRFKRGKIVSLEPFSLEKYKEFYQLYLSSKSSWENFLLLPITQEEGAKKFIAQQYNDDHFSGYFVIDNQTKKMVGFILGEEIDNNSIMRSRAIGTQYQHQGYGYEAAQLFENIMKKAGYASITLSCNIENFRAKELLLRDGYQYLKNEHIQYGSVFADFQFFLKQL